MHQHCHEITLGLSFALGALHALEPGHGKTAMLVYLSSGKRSLWHPIAMGISTAVSHSVSLLAIAFAVHVAHHCLAADHHHEGAVSFWLQWISGIMIVAIGLWMLRQAFRGTAQSCCGHHAKQAKSSPCKHHTSDNTRRGYATTILLGIAIGLLPCPSALAAYFTGLSSGSPAQAYWVILLFGLGIACSLTAVGMVLRFFGGRLSNFFSNSKINWGLARASVILLIGLVYTARIAF